LTYQLNNKVRDLLPYEPIAGNFRIRLDANESFFTVPEQLLKEMQAAANLVDFRRYPDPLAENCIMAFANYFGLSAAQVTAGNGSDELISVIMGGFFQRGDRVLVVDPDFSMYKFYLHVSELEAVTYAKDSAYRIDVDGLVAKASETKCRGMIFSNPCNPTSQGISRQEIIQILQELPNTLIIIDEAYMDFWDQSVLDLVNDFDNLLVLRTCSKAFGIAALRLGFAVANAKLTKALRSLKSPYNVNSLTQAYGSVLLNHPQCLKQALLSVLSSRDALYQDLDALQKSTAGKNLGLLPLLVSHTNFILAKFADNNEVYQRLKQEGILVRCFPDFLRITTGSVLENQTLIDALIKNGEVSNEKR
jgi:histidinol-phosphate aminotransferase